MLRNQDFFPIFGDRIHVWCLEPVPARSEITVFRGWLCSSWQVVNQFHSHEYWLPVSFTAEFKILFPLDNSVVDCLFFCLSNLYFGLTQRSIERQHFTVTDLRNNLSINIENATSVTLIIVCFVSKHLQLCLFDCFYSLFCFIVF